MSAVRPFDASKCGGYPTEIFVDQPDEDFLCGFCQNVVKDPLQCCAEQTHLLCASCVQNEKNKNRNEANCPQCNCSLENVVKAPLAAKLINKLIVKCPCRFENDTPCEWTGPLPYYSVKECAQQMVVCPLFSVDCCGDVFCGLNGGKHTRLEMAAHLSSEKQGGIVSMVEKLVAKILKKNIVGIASLPVPLIQTTAPSVNILEVSNKRQEVAMVVSTADTIDSEPPTQVSVDTTSTRIAATAVNERPVPAVEESPAAKKSRTATFDETFVSLGSRCSLPVPPRRVARL